MHILLLSVFLVFISLGFLVLLLFHTQADGADFISLPLALSVAETTLFSPHCPRVFTEHVSESGRVPVLSSALEAMSKE